jgi:hypothetical protein
MSEMLKEGAIGNESHLYFVRQALLRRETIRCHGLSRKGDSDSGGVEKIVALAVWGRVAEIAVAQ